MILKCAITDDEPLALDLLESYVRKTPCLQLCGRYSSAVEALGELREKPVDLLFLDIQMPDLSGLELSRMIDPATRIVFTTAFGSYALESYKVNALDYLLKPISYPEFLQAADKAVKWFSLTGRNPDRTGCGISGSGDESIFVKSEYRLLQIPLESIVYIEGMKDYVKIYTTEAANPVVSLMNMRDFEKMLPSSRFIRVHRSYIVQKNKIRIIERSRIVFGDKYIPVGDSYREAFQDFIENRKG